MKTLLALTWAASGLVVLGLLGCDLNIGQSPPRTVYVEREQPDYVVVQEAPPEVIVERRSPAPSGEYIWIDGYWHWNSHKYVWEHGHWARPPHEHYIWVAPRYERQEHGYRYMPGRWREGKPEEHRGDEHGDRH